MVAPRFGFPAPSDNFEACHAVGSVLMVQVRSVGKDVCEDMLLVQGDDIRSSKGLAMVDKPDKPDKLDKLDRPDDEAAEGIRPRPQIHSS